MSNPLNKIMQFLLLGFSLLLFACHNKETADNYTDTPTTGKVSIAVDATFQKVIAAELPVFHAMYKYAEITPLYITEKEAINLLLLDSVRLAVLTRPLNRNEKSYFHAKKFIPKEIPIAIDGIAVIVNPLNPNTLLTLNQLRKIMSGEISDWNQVDPGSKSGKIKVVFDHPNSSILRLIADSIAKSPVLGSQLSAFNSSLEVVDFVSANQFAIGLIGVSWISDSRDAETLLYLKKIKVAGISASERATDTNTYLPFQADIAKGKYPLTRFIYMILSEPRPGLGTGFTSFVASDKGQKIIQKTGILPYTLPERIVNIKADY